MAKMQAPFNHATFLNMLDYLVRRNGTFEEFAKRFSRLIDSIVTSFTRDKMLARVEGIDDLRNVALFKLFEAIKDFKYEELTTEEDNERRFIGLVKTYVRNEMIDHQYAANLNKRKPIGCSILYTDESNDQNDNNDQFETEGFEIISNSANTVDVAIANELRSSIYGDLRGRDRVVFRLICCGWKPEEIARSLGLDVSRIRYIIYHRIQPVARRYADAVS